MRYQCGAKLCGFGTEGVAAVVETTSALEDVVDDPESTESNDGYSSGSDIVPVGKRSKSRPLEDSAEDVSAEDVDNDTEAALSPDGGCQELQLLGGHSIFAFFFVDESLSCPAPIEKHLYEILTPSVNTSPPCFYCGETDLVRTSIESENVYPLCQYCRTVKKFGSVQKRKRRTIVPRKQKPKNKKSKKTVNIMDKDDEGEGGAIGYGDDNEDFGEEFQGLEDEDREEEQVPEQSQSDDGSIASDGLGQVMDQEKPEEAMSSEDGENFPSLLASPIPEEWSYNIPVEDLLAGLDED